MIGKQPMPHDAIILSDSRLSGPRHPDPGMLEEVKALPLFRGVPQRLVESLLTTSSRRRYAAGAMILRQGEHAPDLHIIRRGIVDLAHFTSKSNCGILLLSSKDLLLPATTLFHEPALVSARALTNTTILTLEGHAVESALAQSFILSLNLMKAVSGQWRMVVRTVLDLNCRTAAQRVGAFLLRLSDLQSEAVEPILPIAKRHLAVRLGISPETLSRMLQTVTDHGLHLRGRTIVIRDRAAIEEFCGPDPYPIKDERSLDVFAL